MRQVWNGAHMEDIKNAQKMSITETKGDININNIRIILDIILEKYNMRADYIQVVQDGVQQ
jgi:hypothetical protein